MYWNITERKQFEDAIFELKFQVAKKIGIRRGMTVVDMGCGQGGFTVSTARIVGELGKVLSVDVSDEYLAEFTENLSKWRVKNIVTFIKADAASLKDALADGIGDMVVSYRFLEELKHAEDMNGIVKEMARTVKENGKVCIVEISTQPRNEAENNYVRLHKESGDSLFEPDKIMAALKQAGLSQTTVETFDTNLWFSPSLAKQDLGFAQIWYTPEVEETLGALIEKYGMKYPRLLMHYGVKE